jgi:Protein of unknown function (DUF3618)
VMDRRDDTDRYLEESEIAPDESTTQGLAAEGDTEAEIEVIEADIVETRAELGGTLGEIGDRLDPGRLADEARSKVREATVGRVEEAVESAGETARGVSDMLLDTIKKNPIPAALTGIGIAWLWRNRSDGGTNGWQAGRHEYGRDLYRRDLYGTGRYQSSEAEGGLGQTVDGARQGAKQAGERVGETAGQLAEGAQEVAGNVAYGAQRTAGELGSQAQRIMNDMPLAVGVLALGAGAVVGALVPETPVEQEMLGEPSSQLLEAAGDTASDAGEKAQRAAKRATAAARQEVSSGT